MGAEATASVRRRSDAGSNRIAAWCIEQTLGVTVEDFDVGGRQGAHDLGFEFRGRSVAAEVKRVVDQRWREAEQLMGRLGYTTDSRLTSSWNVVGDLDARIRQVHAAAPELLILAESIGWEGGGDLWRLRRVDRYLHDEFERLHVTQAWRHPPTDKHPPGFYVGPEGWGGMLPTVDLLPKIASDLLAHPTMEKMRRQLGDAEADERHTFLFIGWENMAGILLSDPGEELPSSEPVLPEPIDGVWLTSTAAGSRVVAWLPERGWFNAVPLP